MQKRIFFFKRYWYPVLVTSLVSCSLITGDGNQDAGSGHVQFAVLDVGQGLSQAILKNKEVVFCDMGDVDEYPKWSNAYTNTLGEPYIQSIIISHGDMDHKGGLTFLPEDIFFSGRIITSPYEDTAALRTLCTNWSTRISFQTIKQGDSLALFDNVTAVCLWPPWSADSNAWIMDNFTVNRFSLCLKVMYGNTSFLITSDIDTVAMGRIADTYRYQLMTDIVVVPHHGSAGSLHPLFYGYANPVFAIISCGENNLYGHPADGVVKFLAFQLAVKIHDTRYDMDCVRRSNGAYWAR